MRVFGRELGERGRDGKRLFLERRERDWEMGVFEENEGFRERGIGREGLEGMDFGAVLPSW